MATGGSVSGGASYARGSDHRANRTNNHRPLHHSRGLQMSTEFVEKNYRYELEDLQRWIRTRSQVPINAR